MPFPIELPRINPVAENHVNGAHRDGRPGAAIDKSGGSSLFGRFLERQGASRIPTEQMRNDWSGLRIWGNDFLAVRAKDIAIAEGCLGRPNPLLGLLLLTLTGFLREVVDIVLG